MKRCPFCAEEIQDAAIKCRFCNSMLTPGAGAAGGLVAEQPLTGVPVSTGHHEVAPPTPIYGGTPSWRARFWQYSGAVLLVLVGVSLSVVVPTVFKQPWAVSLGVGGVMAVIGLVCWLYLEVHRRSLHYRVSTRTIDVESGILSKRIETLQLWKVRDLEFVQTFVDRLLNVARIHVLTHDAITPDLTLWGIPESRAIFDQLKDAVELSRQSRNVIGVMQ